MARTEPFEKYCGKYQEWFEKNKYVYRSELNCLKKLLPSRGLGMEIGVGSGKFAEPLGIKIGIEPSEKMAKLALKRGIVTVKGTGENLPFFDKTFDYVLMVTTVCFLDDVEKSFGEVNRVLKKSGKFIVGFVDKNTLLGNLYQEKKDKNVFYRIADFYTSKEIINYMKKTAFGSFQTYQTIFKPLSEINKIEPVEKGYGKGGFVGISGKKTQGE
jgi:ubiquinone/menaquinone biosynthesis C-methylase UbiE